jgi:hypothetical protein
MLRLCVRRNVDQGGDQSQQRLLLWTTSSPKELAQLNV